MNGNHNRNSRKDTKQDRNEKSSCLCDARLQAFFESDAGKKEFEEWIKQKESKP